MKKIILSIALGALLTACHDETPSPLWHDVSQYYQPAADDTSYVAQLRRQFLQETGSYLLFNDTIRHEFLGYNAEGLPVYDTETLNLNYSIGSSSESATQTYTLISDTAQMRQAMEFVNEYITWHFTGYARPYMYLLCSTITTKHTSGEISTDNAVTGQRGMAVACNYILQRERTDAQKQRLADRVVNAMLSRVTADNIERFADFLALSQGYYGVTLDDYGTDRTATARRLGFISTSSGGYSAPSQEADLAIYADAVQQRDSAQFASLYGQWPIIMQKYNIMRQRLPELGYIKERGVISY